MSDPKQLCPHITTTPGVHGGDPCIAWTRIPVVGMPDSVAKALVWYPDLTQEQAIAAVAFAAGMRWQAAQRSAIDSALDDARDAIERLSRLTGQQR